MRYQRIQSSTQGSNSSILHVFSDRLLEASLFSVICLAPFVLGGRHAFGEFVLVLSVLPGVVGLLLKWVRDKEIAISQIEAVFILLFCGLPLLQGLPLPSSVVEFVHPGIGQLAKPELIERAVEVTGLKADHPLPSNSTFSIAPSNTSNSMPLLLVFAASFSIAKQYFSSSGSVIGLLRLLTIAATSMAILSLLQANFGNGKFLWVYEHPDRNPGTIPRGPFQNENHLASFLALTVPASCFLLTFSKGVFDRIIAFVSLLSITLTVFFTPSRGGMVIVSMAFLLWFAVIVWALLRERLAQQVNQRRWMNSGVILLLVCFTVGCVLFATNLESLAPWRAKLWRADLRLWTDFPVFGIGLRNHEFAYRAYLQEYSGNTFNFAESSWIQILVETGFVGFAFSVLTLGAILVPIYIRLIHCNSRKDFALLAIPVVTIAISSIHAMADFPWHIPACFCVLTIIAAAAVHLSQLPNQLLNRRAAQSSSFAIVVILCLGVGWSVSSTASRAKAASHWDAYQRLTSRTPAQAKAGSYHLDNSFLESRLLDVITYQPNHIHARQKLLRLQTQRFRQNFFVLDDPQKVASRLLQQSRYLVRIAPTTVEPYFCSSLVLSARNASFDEQELLLDHAQLLEPNNGYFAMHKGLIALQKSDIPAFRRQFEVAINHYPPTQSIALEQLLSIESVSEILSSYQLETQTLAKLYSLTATQDKEEHRLVGAELVRRLISEAVTVGAHVLDRTRLQNAFYVASSINDFELQLKILSLKIEQSIDLRDSMVNRAKLFAQNGQVDKALQDLENCLQLFPSDVEVNRMSMQFRKEQFR